MPPASSEQQLSAYYRVLFDAFGSQHWWPARTPFEVIVGAYLTQNTSWTNAEIALRALRTAGLLNLAAIRKMHRERLETMIRPAGYFRQKAARLKTFVTFVDRRYGGSLRRVFAQPTEKLREELLSLNGVGPETADSILLYAGQHPVFVVDAYARRILDRHRIEPADANYEELRRLFERALASETRESRFTKLRTDAQKMSTAARPVPHSPSPMSLTRRSPLAQVYNEMHALIVTAGKHYCFKSNPNCMHCPLRTFLPEASI